MRRKDKKPKLEKEHGDDLKRYMVQRGWMVKKITGSEYMVGFPDYYCSHIVHGPRWIELKRPGTGRLSDVQIRVFGQFTRAGTGIWLLETVADYPKLFKPPNWTAYLL